MDKLTRGKNSDKNKQLKYSLRKLSIGLVSCVVGAFIAFSPVAGTLDLGQLGLEADAATVTTDSAVSADSSGSTASTDKKEAEEESAKLEAKRKEIREKIEEFKETVEEQRAAYQGANVSKMTHMFTTISKLGSDLDAIEKKLNDMTNTNDLNGLEGILNSVNTLVTNAEANYKTNGEVARKAEETAEKAKLIAELLKIAMNKDLPQDVKDTAMNKFRAFTHHFDREGYKLDNLKEAVEKVKKDLQRYTDTYKEIRDDLKKMSEGNEYPKEVRELAKEKLATLTDEELKPPMEENLEKAKKIIEEVRKLRDEKYDSFFNDLGEYERKAEASREKIKKIERDAKERAFIEELEKLERQEAESLAKYKEKAKAQVDEAMDVTPEDKAKAKEAIDKAKTKDEIANILVNLKRTPKADGDGSTLSREEGHDNPGGSNPGSDEGKTRTKRTVGNDNKAPQTGDAPILEELGILLIAGAGVTLARKNKNTSK